MKRLSDAIDEGSLLKPQAFDGWTKGKSCALQAAVDGLGLEIDWLEVGSIYPWIRTNAARCPHDDCIWSECVEVIIFHLNDQHHMPRPEIAAWVRTIEPESLESPQAVALEAGEHVTVGE